MSQLYPVTRGIKGDIARLDLHGFLGALLEIAGNTSLFPKRIDKAWVEVSTAESKEALKIDVSDLYQIKERANESTKILLVKIYSQELTANIAIELIPSYWVEALFNFDNETAEIRFATVGAENHEKIWGIIEPHIQLVSQRLPKHHSYLGDFLGKFHRDHGDSNKNIFLIMRFRDEPPFPEIVSSIESACAQAGINVLRADMKEYSPDLWDNVLVYLYGCGGAIAVFDQINYREFNPNVALEAGFVIATGRPLLVLKDQAIPVLPSDLSGRLYRDFNTYQPSATITPQVTKWLRDNLEMFA